MIVELLFAEGNHVCAVCVANGHCELQDAGVAWAWTTSGSTTSPPKREVDISHERFGIDHNRCILCTRCVRVCDEIEGAHTWDVAGRGAQLARSSPT
jgi:bidirectional [NiFe] hydrogenase diaphorase subunit